MGFEKGNPYRFKRGKNNPNYIKDELSKKKMSRQLKHYYRKKKREKQNDRTASGR